MEILKISNQNFGMAHFTKQSKAILQHAVDNTKTTQELIEVGKNMFYIKNNLPKDAYLHAINLPNNKVHLQLSSHKNRFAALFDYNFVDYKPFSFIYDKKKNSSAGILDSFVKSVKEFSDNLNK